jgi:hypothetical protein
MRTDVAFADLGNAATAFVFDGTSKPFLVGLSERPTGDPACEAGKACAAMHVADGAPFGLAARLTTTPGTGTLVRVRLSSTISDRGPREVLVRLVAPSGEVSDVTARSSGTWEDVTLPIPSGAAEVGVAIGLAPRLYDCYSPGPPFGDVAIGAIVVE